MDLRSTYDRIAEDWRNDHTQDDWWVEGTDTFAALLEPGATVLDVGCGPGVKTKYLINKGLAVTGIDFSEKMIEIAKRDVPEGEFSVRDIYDIKNFERKFDAIFAQAVLLHIPKAKVRGVIADLAQKLNPGGYLYVAVKEARPGEKEEQIEVESDYGYSYERFFSYYTLEELKGYFSDVGLRAVYENVASSGKRRWIQLVGKI